MAHPAPLPPTPSSPRTGARPASPGPLAPTHPDRGRRGWALCGAVAGPLGAVGLFGTAGIYTQEAWEAADNAEMARSVSGSTTLVWAHQAVAAVTAGLLVVFAVGLYRYLAVREPAHGLVPGVASAGVLLTAVALFLGAGLDTELWWSVRHGAAADPDTVGAMVSHYGAVPWLWGGLTLSAAAVAVAGLVRGSVGRVTATGSAVLAFLLAATQVGPVQYIAVLPGALWLLATGTALARHTTAPKRTVGTAH
ncbi:hypothetical protein [Pseudonocardia alni]|uniref:hypothetical protein n=1 Tax=Pseudonocardia alni TaxID=33907 RepID=UPI00280BA001|nr:hypothetical protein [Pseudonocardia alni]